MKQDPGTKKLTDVSEPHDGASVPHRRAVQNVEHCWNKL